jgi:c-di-GMP-related signal transduction protein
MALFGKKTQSAPLQDPKGPEKVAPENPYLGREPIIDRDQAIIGYDLFFRPATTLKAKRVNERNEVLAQIAKRLAADPKAEVTYPDEITDMNLRDDDGNEIKEVTLSEMLYALKTKGVAQSLGLHLGFIKIHLHQLGDELRGIPAIKFPLQIDLAEILEAIKTEVPREENVKDSKKDAKNPDAPDESKVPEILEKLEKLSNTGYKLVLTGLTEVFDGLEDILPKFRYVKLDIQQVDNAASLIEFCKATPLPKDTKSPAKKGAKAGSDSPVMQIIATHVETPEDFHKARDLGCDAYEGFYFVKPDPDLSLHRGDDYRKILKLLTLLLSSPELHELVDEIEMNPVVAKHLMVIAEVDAGRKRAKPENIRDAAVISGVKRITRWTQLLLYADSKAKVSLESTPLLQLVCVRAFFMELASAKLPAGAGLGSSDLAFLVGGLSLIDNLFDESSREILSKFNLPGVVVDAIADRSGVLGKLLTLAEAAEVGDIEKCQHLCADDLGSLTLDDVAQDSLLAIKTFVAQTQLAPDEDVWEQAEATEEE